MAQVQLDVLYDVKGLGALKQSQTAMNAAAKATADANGRLRDAKGRYIGAGAAAKGAAGGVRAFGNAVKGLAGLAGVTSAVVAFGAALNTIVNADFSKAKLRSLGVDADDLSQRLATVSKELGYQASQAELLGAAYDVASAGFTDAADAAAVLKAASLGATGGFAELNTVANATTSVLNAYGASAQDAEKYVDQFIQTQNDGKIVVAEYADNIGKVASAAAGLKIPLAEVNAIIAQSTAAGVKAEVAFTGVKSALARLASGEASKALEPLGVNINAATLASDGLIGTLEKIKASGADTGAVFKALGTEAAPALLPVLNNLDKANELLENQKTSAGAAAAAQQLAANTLKGAWTAAIGALSNLVVQLLPLFKPLGQVIMLLAKAIGTVATNIGQILRIAASFGAAVVVFKGAAIATKAWAAATFLLAKGMKAAAVAKSALLALTGKGLLLVAGAGAAAAATYYALGEAMGDSSEQQKQYNADVAELEGLMGSLQVAGEGLIGTLGQIGQTPEGAGPGLTAIDEKVQKLQTDADVLGQKLQGALTAETTGIENALRVTQARYAAENQILDARKQSATAALEAAETDADREKAAREIYEQTVRQAEIQYNATVAAAEAEEQKLAAQARYIEGQVKIQQMKLAEAQASKTVTQAHYEAVNQANQALQTAQQNIQAQQQITDAIVRGADATLQKKMEAARVTMEMQMQTQQQAQTNAQIAEGANQMSRLANEAERARAASSGVGVGGGGGGGGGGGMGAGAYTAGKKFIGTKKLDADGKVVSKTQAEMEREHNQLRIGGWKGSIIRYDQIRSTPEAAGFDAGWHAAGLNSADARSNAMRAMQVGGSIGPRGSVVYNEYMRMNPHQQGWQRAQTNTYAEGGYVTGPQQAIVGEGGEPEYIIPASKMDGAMQRYSAGMRGSSMIPSSAEVSVNYNGSTVDMGGTSYINKGDVTGIVSQAVNQTLTTLQRSSKARLTAGLR